jgi:YD repeat-containing protein
VRQQVFGSVLRSASFSWPGPSEDGAPKAGADNFGMHFRQPGGLQLCCKFFARRADYNEVRQLVVRTNANGQITEWDWCGCGSPTQITEWNGNTPLITEFAYDMAGRMTNIVFPDGYTLSYEYDLGSRGA